MSLRHAILIVLCLLGMALLLALPIPANSHEWYGRECCSDRDCEPIPSEAVDVTPRGYRVRYTTMQGNKIDQMVQRSRIRPSQDGGYHACSVYDFVVCLYVPFNS